MTSIPISIPDPHSCLPAAIILHPSNQTPISSHTDSHSPWNTVQIQGHKQGRNNVFFNQIFCEMMLALPTNRLHELGTKSLECFANTSFILFVLLFGNISLLKKVFRRKKNWVCETKLPEKATKDSKCFFNRPGLAGMFNKHLCI